MLSILKTQSQSEKNAQCERALIQLITYKNIWKSSIMASIFIYSKKADDWLNWVRWPYSHQGQFICNVDCVYQTSCGLNFRRTHVLFVGPLVPLFWWQLLGFQSQGRPIICLLSSLCTVPQIQWCDTIPVAFPTCVFQQRSDCGVQTGDLPISAQTQLPTRPPRPGENSNILSKY